MQTGKQCLFPSFGQPLGFMSTCLDLGDRYPAPKRKGLSFITRTSKECFRHGWIQAFNYSYQNSASLSHHVLACFR